MYVVIYHKLPNELGRDRLKIIESFVGNDAKRKAHLYACELNISDKDSWDILNAHFAKSGVDTSKMNREEKMSLLMNDEDSIVAEYGLYQLYDAPAPTDFGS